MHRVLLVDDEPDIRLVARMGLVSRGWEVDEVSSGQEALDHPAHDDFHAIVLDQRMPGLTGIETAERLRERGYGGALVLFSGYLTPEVETSARSLGLRTLDKARVRELRSTLEELLDAS